MASMAARGRSIAAAEAKRQAAKLVLSLIVIIACVVMFVLPSMGIKRGVLLGGGTSVELTLANADGSAASEEDIATSLAILKKRANSLYEQDLEIQDLGEGKLCVRVPALYDAESVAHSLVGTGHAELVSQLDISDADELELLQSSPENLTLAADTYSAFVMSENITAAKVVTSGSGDSVTYAVQLTLDAEATQAFAEETEELSSSYGLIAVIIDGEIVSTPYVSSKIESSEITISGGFTREEAYSIAAKLNTDELPLTLTVGEATQFEDVCAGAAPWVAFGVALALGLVVALVLARQFGHVGWLAFWSLASVVLVGLGAMSILALFDFVILGTFELVSGVVVALASLVASGVAAYSYHKERACGTSVRKCEELSLKSMFLAEKFYAFVCVAALVVTFFVSAPASRIAWTLFAGLAVEVVLAWLLKEPVLRILTMPDTLEGAKDGEDAETSEATSSANDAE